MKFMSLTPVAAKLLRLREGGEVSPTHAYALGTFGSSPFPLRVMFGLILILFCFYEAFASKPTSVGRQSFGASRSAVRRTYARERKRDDLFQSALSALEKMNIE